MRESLDAGRSRNARRRVEYMQALPWTARARAASTLRVRFATERDRRRRSALEVLGSVATRASGTRLDRAEVRKTVKRSGQPGRARNPGMRSGRSRAGRFEPILHVALDHERNADLREQRCSHALQSAMPGFRSPRRPPEHPSARALGNAVDGDANLVSAPAPRRAEDARRCDLGTPHRVTLETQLRLTRRIIGSAARSPPP